MNTFLDWLKGEPNPPSYWFTRFVFLRFLGLIYFIAFLVLCNQFKPLIGEHGLLPAGQFLTQVAATHGAASFIKLPSLFWFGSSDTVLMCFALCGLALSLAVMVGFANSILMALLWIIYLSFTEIGQIFYGYGWESLLLEAGFLGIFLCPLLSLKPFPEATPTPTAVVWFFRWLLFRVIFGAGLIKLRGDSCWYDLTCLVYHYETQPIPNPISWYLHQMPVWFHQLGVLWNHFIEVLVPWMVFGPRRVRHIAGILLISFQIILIISGNLSFLNWLTIAVCIPCFDDRLLRRLFPGRIREAVESYVQLSVQRVMQRRVIYGLTAVIMVLSIQPTLNLFSGNQLMNASFDPLRLVNTYGAFGSVGRTRNEIIFQGTYDKHVTDSTNWVEYEFNCKPGNVNRRPCIISPYHYRLDWQIWFAAMSDYRRNPWLVHLIYKLLQGDNAAVGLLDYNPFPDQPPRFIRAELYEYEFTDRSDPGQAWWKRKRVGAYLPPLSTNHPGLRQFIKAYGWVGKD